MSDDPTTADREGPAPAAATTRDLAPGTALGGYVVESRLARGGMGVVYRARDAVVDRPVALKVIAPEHARDPAFREARAILAQQDAAAAVVFARGIEARATMALGDLDAGIAATKEVLRELQPADEPWMILDCLEGLAAALSDGDGATAARLWAACERERLRTGSPWSPTERKQFAPRLSAARAQCGVEAFDAAWSDGASMTLADAYALEHT